MKTILSFIAGALIGTVLMFFIAICPMYAAVSFGWMERKTADAVALSWLTVTPIAFGFLIGKDLRKP